MIFKEAVELHYLYYAYKCHIRRALKQYHDFHPPMIFGAKTCFFVNFQKKICHGLISKKSISHIIYTIHIVDI